MHWRPPRARSAAVLLLLGALCLGTFALHRAEAELATPGSCGSPGSAAVATGSTFECDYVTQAAVKPGNLVDEKAMLLLTITSPPGSTFAGTGVVANSLPLGCTAISMMPPSLLITCVASSAGIPKGTPVQLLLNGAAFGAIAMTARYSNPPPPPTPTPTPFAAPPFTYQFDSTPTGIPGPASVTTRVGTAAPTISCINTTPANGTTPAKPPNAQLLVGDTFSCTATYPAGQTPSFVTVTSTPLNGTLAVTINPGPANSERQAANSNGFICGNPVTNTACQEFMFTGTAAAAGTPNITIASFAIGAATPYNTTTTGVGAIGPVVGRTVPTGPIVGAVGCASGTQSTDIAFPAVPLSPTSPNGSQILASTTQFSSSPPLAVKATVPAVLSTVAPNVVAICGAVFQDSGIAASDTDANPNTIDAGTITYTVSSPLAIVTESNSSTYTINCGSLNPPPQVGNNACNSSVSAPAFTTPPPTPAFISPVPTNLIHVALVPGATFALLGRPGASIPVSATYTRVAATGSRPLSLTTNTATIAVLPPPYQIALTASPLQVGASGNGAGSTITATLVHPAVAGCLPLAGGSFVICVGAPTLFFGTPASGAESGLVTFRTDAGVLGNPNDPSTSASQLQYSVHCGPIVQPSVIIDATPPSFSSCTSVSVVLYGAGAPGTATVTASFAGDVTGSTADAVATVQLIPAGPPVMLTRGCNQVVTPSNLAVGTSVSQVVGLVQPSNIVVSVWQFNNSSHRFLAGSFSVAAAPTDFDTVGPNQGLFICVSGSGTFPSGAI